MLHIFGSDFAIQHLIRTVRPFRCERADPTPLQGYVVRVLKSLFQLRNGMRIPPMASVHGVRDELPNPETMKSSPAQVSHEDSLACTEFLTRILRIPLADQFHVSRCSQKLFPEERCSEVDERNGTLRISKAFKIGHSVLGDHVHRLHAGVGYNAGETRDYF